MPSIEATMVLCATWLLLVLIGDDKSTNPNLGIDSHATLPPSLYGHLFTAEWAGVIWVRAPEEKFDGCPRKKVAHVWRKTRNA